VVQAPLAAGAVVKDQSDCRDSCGGLLIFLVFVRSSCPNKLGARSNLPFRQKKTVGDRKSKRNSLYFLIIVQASYHLFEGYRLHALLAYSLFIPLRFNGLSELKSCSKLSVGTVAWEPAWRRGHLQQHNYTFNAFFKQPRRDLERRSFLPASVNLVSPSSRRGVSRASRVAVTRVLDRSVHLMHIPGSLNRVLVRSRTVRLPLSPASTTTD